MASNPTAWTGALAPPDPGIVIYADLHRSPPSVAAPYNVVRDERDAPESGITVVSPLAGITLDPKAVAREIAVAWCPVGEEEHWLAARPRLADFCTHEERAILDRVSWDDIIVEAQQLQRKALRWYEDALSGNHGPADLFDGHVPTKKRLRREIEDRRAWVEGQIRRIGWMFVDAYRRRVDREDIGYLMQEAPPRAADAHTKLNWTWRGE